MKIHNREAYYPTFCSEACFTAYKLRNYNFFTKAICTYHKHFYVKNEFFCYYFSLTPNKICNISGQMKEKNYYNE